MKARGVLMIPQVLVTEVLDIIWLHLNIECDHMIKVPGQRFHAQEGGAKY